MSADITDTRDAVVIGGTGGVGHAAARLHVVPAHQSQGVSNYRERNSTADKALDILLMFDDSRPTVAAAEVASHLHVARSTAYRYLQSLVQSGFVEEHPGGGFRLGPRILELARLARRGVGLSELAQPVMHRLAATTGETVLLTRLAGTAVICLERADATERAIRVSYEPGQVLPTNAGASAHVLLAWLDPSDLERILATTRFTRFTHRTVVDADRLRRRLADTRAEGVAVSRGELDPDVLGIAAPVRGEGDRVVAGLGVAAVASRIADEQVDRIAGEVRNAAAEIGTRLRQLAQ